jgi:hypothetical protein
MAALALTGCSTPKGGVPQRAAQLPYSFAETWDAVVAEMNAFDTNSVANPFSGTVEITNASPDILYIEEFAIRPGAGLVSWGSMRMFVNVSVKPVTEKETAVSVACRYYRFRIGNDHRWYRWPSNGELEEDLLAKIATRLNREKR